MAPGKAVNVTPHPSYEGPLLRVARVRLALAGWVGVGDPRSLGPVGFAWEGRQPRWILNRGARAFTLVELMVVITIIGIMTALMIPEMKGSLQDALLRSTSRDLINVFDLAYSRAVSLNQTRRVLLDEATGRYLVQKLVVENGQENFVPAEDVPGDKGQLDSRITVEFHPPGEGSSEGTSGAAPAAETVSGGTAIAFYPDGTADAGEVWLRDRDGFRLMLKINPVTARIHVVELSREGAP